MRKKALSVAVFLCVCVMVYGSFSFADDGRSHKKKTPIPTCQALLGAPPSDSLAKKIYDDVIFYEAIDQGQSFFCAGQSARTYMDSVKTLEDVNKLTIIKSVPVNAAFIVVVGELFEDAKGNSILVPSIITIRKNAKGTLEGFKIIYHTTKEKAVFSSDITDVDIARMLAKALVVLVGRIDHIATSENAHHAIFDDLIRPYIDLIERTVSLKCSTEKEQTA